MQEISTDGSTDIVNIGKGFGIFRQKRLHKIIENF